MGTHKGKEGRRASVFFRINWALSIHGKIPRLPIIFSISDIAASNRAFNIGFWYTPYPPNNASIEMVVGIKKRTVLLRL